MKHTPRITLYLLTLFVLAQLIGVGVLTAYVDVQRSADEGKTVFREMDIAGVVVEPPPVEEDVSFVYIAGAILFGTLIVFLLLYFHQIRIWRFWFFLATVLTLTLAFAAFIPSTIALIVALVMGALRIYRPHILIQNLTELFTYGGLAALFVPIINMNSALGLLLFISFYDMYAVWKSKHMVTLAKATATEKIFAGLMLPYDQKGIIFTPQPLAEHKTHSPSKKQSSSGPRSAILGGGDIGFPLFFIGVVLRFYGLWPALLIIPFATFALGLLFYSSEQGKFYPAMPFLSFGCLIGFRMIWIFL